MKVALTIWGNRISPVFDSARKLLVAEVENSRAEKKQYESLDTEMISELTEMLTNLEINVLICGAISKRFSDIIETGGIKLIPFITGHVDGF
ncbi:MAG: dinitrogenase iron-molybdenum cofactor biosynthesis domain-containing protein [Desulfobacteraceae bacterium]|nr:dinitrogenase iron-molybdenum cofactor biosynthesis domain-containing protein [Desulfobacteraceae bacterium]